MKLKLKKTLKFVLTSITFLIPCWQSAQAQCEVGPVLFRDTLFGAGIGAGVGALILVANETSDKVPAKLATATLIGAGVGILVGVVELSFSDCGSGNRHVRNSEQPGFHAEPLFAFVNKPIIYGKNLENDTKNPFELANLSNISMGLKVQYTFSNL
ncbi:hypothetical protein [Fluviispira multicolorata]|uniref:Uncharacterized protein n=1 Tax=Fluviispira multicolorata TaxID=2654512 RepID=A0A833N4H0_9BACT|nr:hypothetical protein [Fluviispira multicolorata]KAB8027985.1 hypothetical protein GCL57_13095 [Fluviispira multicolorata]